MATKLYIGNLSFNVTQVQIRDLFSQAGEVKNITLITDRWTATPKGFGFVEMATEEAAQEAIRRFHSHLLLDRLLTVHESSLREERMGNVISGTVI